MLLTRPIFVFNLDETTVIRLIWIDWPQRPHDFSVKNILFSRNGRDRTPSQEPHILRTDLATLLAVEHGVLDLEPDLQPIGLCFNVWEMEENLSVVRNGFDESKSIFEGCDVPLMDFASLRSRLGAKISAGNGSWRCCGRGLRRLGVLRFQNANVDSIGFFRRLELINIKSAIEFNSRRILKITQNFL